MIVRRRETANGEGFEEVGDESNNTTTYSIDAQTIKTLHTRYLRYKFLYREACRQLKKCQTMGRRLEGDLTQVHSQNTILIEEQSRLQSELDQCNTSKTYLQSLFGIFRVKSVNTSTEQSKMLRIYYEKQELKRLQEQLLLQENVFDSYERESNSPPMSSTDRLSDQLSDQQTVIEAEYSKNDMTLDFRLQTEKLERDISSLQLELSVVSQTNDNLTENLHEMKADNEKIQLTLGQREIMIEALKTELSNTHRGYIERLNREADVLKICEREKNKFKESIENCRETLFEKDEELERAQRSISELEQKILAVVQELENERRTFEDSRRDYDADRIFLTKRNDNLTKNNAHFYDQERELRAEIVNLQSESTQCRQKLQELEEREHSWQASSSHAVQGLSNTIELNNNEYREKQNQYEQKISKLRSDLTECRRRVGSLKSEKSDISETNEKLKSRVQELVRDVKDLENLKTYVNGFISENYNFQTDVEIPEALLKITEKNRATNDQFQALQQDYVKLELEFRISSDSLAQHQAISEEQGRKIEKLDAELDHLRLENQSLKLPADRSSSFTLLLPSSKDHVDRLAKLKRSYRAQLSDKRMEIQKLTKKIRDLRQENGLLTQQSRSPAFELMQGEDSENPSVRQKKVAALEMEVFRLRRAARLSLEDLSKTYGPMLQESEKTPRDDESTGFGGESTESRSVELLRYYTLFVECLSAASASLDTEGCSEGFMSMINLVRDFKNYKLDVSQLSLSKNQITAEDVALFQNVQHAQEEDEWRRLRTIDRKYEAIISTLQYLLSEDVVHLVSILAEYRVYFPAGGLLALTNYLKAKNLDLSSIQANCDLAEQLVVFFGTNHSLSFNVTSMRETLEIFGGQAFVQSLRHIASLQKIHPEYGSLYQVLKDAGTVGKIDNFLVWLQLIRDIRVKYSHIVNFEELQHAYITDTLNQQFDLKIDNLEYYFRSKKRRLRKQPRRSESPVLPETEMETTISHEPPGHV